jgi:preprotein translocase subunit YajC
VSGFGFLLIIVAFVFLYFVLVRPQKRRQLQQQRMLDDLQVGDEVVTAGGIYGEITRLDDADDVYVRIAPELEVRVARRAIAGVFTDHEHVDEPVAEPTAET